MPSSIPRKQRVWVYRFLIERDGLKCHTCEVEKTPLEIHHVDGNPANENPNNLCLLCHSCHVKISIKQAKDRGINVERERKNKSSDPTKELKSKVNYNDGSPEMQVNEYTEITYRNWLIAKIKASKEGMISKKEAIYSGAEITGGSVNACRGYYGKMVSDEGALEDGKIAGKGTKFVKFKGDPKN